MSTDASPAPGRAPLRLLLLRHAKSDWPDGVADLERPLAARGRSAAAIMGRYLATEGLTADRVLVSPAARTRETWRLVDARLPATPEVLIQPRIYEAASPRLLSLIQEQPEAVRTLMLVGHNPGLEDLAAILTGDGPAEARSRLAAKYPTGALAVIDFPAMSWGDAVPGSGRLDRFVTPRSLPGEE